MASRWQVFFSFLILFLRALQLALEGCILYFLVVGNSPCPHGMSTAQSLYNQGLLYHFGGGHGNPLQYSYLENPMHRGAWQATGLRIAESDTTEVT